MSDRAKIIKIEIDYPDSPFEAFCKLEWQKSGFLLESAMVGERLGRWSFMGAEPFLTFSAEGRRIALDRQGEIEQRKGNPFSALKALMGQFVVQRQ